MTLSPNDKECELSVAEQREQLHHFPRNIEVLRRRAKVLGVTMHYFVEQKGTEVMNHPDVMMFGASVGKIPLAHMVIEHLNPDEDFDINKDDIVDGGGAFDQSTSQGIAKTAELLEDMLKNSGNTAFRLLAERLGGPDEIQAYYEQNGWVHTTVDRADNGRTILGQTTPSEVLAQLQLLIAPGSPSPLSVVARDALQGNTVSVHGIRQNPLDNSLTVYNKTGEYNGDKSDPYVVRHDVGVVQGRKGTINYAVMTKSPRFARGLIANQVVRHFGAEMLVAAGSRDLKQLGSLACSAS